MLESSSGWFNQTTLHPIGVLVLVLLGAATLLVPRRYALVPALVLACLVAPAQRIVVATLDFNFLRVMVCVGWLRVIVRGEMTGFRWKPIDSAFLAWALCSTVIGALMQASNAGLVNRLGFCFDALGMYFLARVLLRSWDDLFAIVRSAAVISMPVAVAFLFERATGRNPFAFFGGVPEITTVRDGRLRCQGPFAHPILAGTFWATLMPLIGALWWCRHGMSRALAVVGIAGSTVVVFTCASATPLGGVISAGIAVAMFPLRRRLGWIRWGSVLALVSLHLVMAKPVWHLLLARVPLVSGSTGWYRYKLLDEFIRNFGDWWLIGTQNWTQWPGPGFQAITNEYVRQGTDGGLVTLGLFVTVILLAFAAIGRLWRGASAPAVRAIAPPRLAMAWALGVSLFVHCVVFMAVSYFGQMILIWYITLGAIGSLAPLGAPRLALRMVHRGGVESADGIARTLQPA